MTNTDEQNHIVVAKHHVDLLIDSSWSRRNCPYRHIQRHICCNQMGSRDSNLWQQKK